MNITISAEGEMPDFDQLAKNFPELKARMLGYIGKQAAQNLYENHLQGQDLNYQPRRLSSSGTPISRTGKRMASYAISRNLKQVSIASFPLNFFENGRMLRSGKREAARHILNGKFSSRLGSTLQFIAMAGKETIFDDWQTRFRKKDSI